MSVEHARSGDLLAVRPDEAGQGPTGAVALVSDPLMEVMRWVLPSGREVPEHIAYGPVTIQCVSGEVELVLLGGPRRLVAGAVVYLAGGERHALRARQDSVLLVTMALVAGPDAAADAAPQPSGGPRPPHGERGRPVVDGK